MKTKLTRLGRADALDEPSWPVDRRRLDAVQRPAQDPRKQRHVVVCWGRDRLEASEVSVQKAPG